MEQTSADKFKLLIVPGIFTRSMDQTNSSQKIAQKCMNFLFHTPKNWMWPKQKLRFIKKVDMEQTKH